MRTITLKSGAFHTELLPIVGSHKIGWSGEDHIGFFEALLPHMTDEDGNPIDPNEAQLNRLRLIFRPSQETARIVLDDTMSEMGLQLDEKTEDSLILLMNMAQFSDYLGKTKRPDSDKPYVLKERKRGVKKSLFNDLIAAPTEETAAGADAATSSGDETVEQEPAPLDEAEAPKDAKPASKPMKPMAAKPTPKR